MTKMNIVADENIPNIDRFLRENNNLILLPGRDIKYNTVKNADALFVRSITQVDENLLSNTNIKFVGSATSGINHIDTEYLKKRNIAFQSAKGANANSVVDYVISSMVVLSEMAGYKFSDKIIGVVGRGYIGSNLIGRLSGMKIRCFYYDPYDNHPSIIGEFNSFITKVDSLATLLSGVDIISLHTPLTMGGDHKTYHMINEHNLNMIKENSILINTSRGEVIDEQSLLDCLSSRHLWVALDAWSNEPFINKKLLHNVSLATPHIAGHSVVGKYNATQILYKGFMKHFGFIGKCVVSNFFQAQIKQIHFGENNNDYDDLVTAILAVYDVRRDHWVMINRFRLNLSNQDVMVVFDCLRHNYPERYEILNTLIAFDRCSLKKKQMFKSIGFPSNEY